MNSTTTNSIIKTSNRELNKKNLVTTKYLIYSQKKSALESSKHFYNIWKALPQNKITWQQFVKSIRIKVSHIYLLMIQILHLIFETKNWQYYAMQYKRLLNNNKIIVEQKNNSICKCRGRKWCKETWYEKSILYLHYFTSTKSFTLSHSGAGLEGKKGGDQFL